MLEKFLASPEHQKYKTVRQQDDNPNAFGKGELQEFSFLDSRGVAENTKQVVVIWTSFNETVVSSGKNTHYAMKVEQLKKEVLDEPQKLAELLRRLPQVVIISPSGKSAEELWGMPGAAPVIDHLNGILRTSGHNIYDPYMPYMKHADKYDDFHLQRTKQSAILCWNIVRSTVCIDQYLRKYSESYNTWKEEATPEEVDIVRKCVESWEKEKILRHRSFEGSTTSEETSARVQSTIQLEDRDKMISAQFRQDKNQCYRKESYRSQRKVARRSEGYTARPIESQEHCQSIAKLQNPKDSQ